MKLVRNPEALWLPSRHRYALARLVAFSLVWRRISSLRPEAEAQAGKPAPHASIAYAIDPDQSTLENYTISVWVLATVTCYLAPFTTWYLAFPAALVAIEIPIYISGLLLNNQRINSIVLWTLLAIASVWGGWVGRFFLGVLIANAVAFAIMFALRKRVRELEARCGA